MRRALLALLSVVLLSCGDDGGSAIDARVDSAPGDPPVISSVTWTHATPCVAGTEGDVVVAITATDADTATTSLSYSGTAEGCTGTVTAASSTLRCPNAASYPGTITVSDPEGHTDSQAVTIEICTDGSAP